MAYVKRTIAAAAIGIGAIYAGNFINEATHKYELCHEQEVFPQNTAWCHESVFASTNNDFEKPKVAIALGGTALLLGTSVWIAFAELAQRKQGDSQTAVNTV